MQYINAVITIIGFIFIFFYQRQKINALERQLITQKEILGNTKAFFDLFDLEKVKGYVEIVEKKVRTEMECQVHELKSEFGKEHEKTNKAVKILLDEFVNVIQPLGKSLLLLSRNQRMTVISGMQGIAKKAFEIMFKDIDEIELKARDAAFSAGLPPRPPKK